jgi:hypothetical protein
LISSRRSGVTSIIEHCQIGELGSSQDYGWTSVQSSSLTRHDEDATTNDASHAYHGQIPCSQSALESEITRSSFGIVTTAHFAGGFGLSDFDGSHLDSVDVQRYPTQLSGQAC